MYESSFTFPGGVFAEFDRLQNLLTSGSLSNSIRAGNQSNFPLINMGNTPTSIEIYAFAPGMSLDHFQVNIDRTLLSISGERICKSAVSEEANKSNHSRSSYANERFKGYFKRVINLPKDADSNNVEAHYLDGVLHIKITRNKSPESKPIKIK